MTIDRAANASNGPAQLDISVEQEADLYVGPFQATLNGFVFDFAVYTFQAWLTVAWNPPSTLKIPLTVTVLDPVNGWVAVSLPAAQVKQLASPDSTPGEPGPPGAARYVKLGGWVLDAFDGTLTSRLLQGDVKLNRDPSV